MNTYRFMLSVLAVFALTFALDYLAHQVLMWDMYRMTAGVWRTADTVVYWPIFVSQLLFALVFVFIFTRNYEGNGYGEGIRYGSYIGFLIATIDLGAYSYLPVPLFLVCAWMIVSIIKCVALGVVSSVFYRTE